MKRALLCTNSQSSRSSLSRELLQELARSSRSNFSGADIYEKNGNLNYELEMPGFSKDDIEVTVQKGNLVISGSAKEEEEKDKKYLMKGRKRGKLRRGLQLPEGIESPENLKAELENGILHVQIPLKEEVDRGPIEVEIK